MDPGGNMSTALDVTLNRSPRIDQIHRDALIRALSICLTAMKENAGSMPETMDPAYKYGSRVLNLVTMEHPDEEQ